MKIAYFAVYKRDITFIYVKKIISEIILPNNR